MATSHVIDRKALAHGLFFIVGPPRSGTTLVQALLSSHSRLFVPPETEYFMRFVPPDDPDPRVFNEHLDHWFASQRWRDQGLDGEELRRRVLACNAVCPGSLFTEFMLMHAERAGKPRVGEKSPHHVRHVGMIRHFFPEAKFIFVHRDPRDTIASTLTMPWSSGSHFAIAREWRRLFEHHLDLASQLPETHYTSLRLETLIESTDAEVRRLCAFLDESYEPGMLAFHERNDAGFNPRESTWKEGTRQPISNASVGRFHRDLGAREIAGIERTIGAELMERAGYESTGSRSNPVWMVPDAIDRGRDVLRRWKRSAKKRVKV